MKKVLPVVIILLLLGIGGYFLMNSKKNPPKMNVEKPKSASANVFTSIKDALSKSMSLKCVYKDEKGVETTSYIKGGSVRVIMQSLTDKEQPNNIILKDKKMYMWNEVSKTGFSFAIIEPKISPNQAAGKTPPVATNKDESILAGIEKYKNACKTEVIADSLFIIPTDVKFQDMADFTKGMLQGVPSVSPVNSEGSVDLKEIMKSITPGADDGQ